GCAPILDAPLSSSTSLLSSYHPVDHRHLHSLPTRRSSDLVRSLPAGCCECRRCSRCPALRIQLPPQHSGRSVRRQRWPPAAARSDRKSTRLNSSHVKISYAVFCLKKKTNEHKQQHSAEDQV